MTNLFPCHDDDPDEYGSEFAGLDLSNLTCGWCLGGFAPAGTHPVLGLVYTACIHCTDPCRCCDATGLFPADTTCMRCLHAALAAVGYTASFCHTCNGVLTVEPVGPAEEVTP